MPVEDSPSLAAIPPCPPAAVAVWSGWVGIGQLCGFGVVHPLPGIRDAAHLDTAITLPIGVEAVRVVRSVGVAGLHHASDHPEVAKWSAISSLTLGMLGQVAYYLLSTARAVRGTVARRGPCVVPVHDRARLRRDAFALETNPSAVPAKPEAGAP